MSDIELENIVKQFGDITAVNDVSLHVDDGEFVTLVGPSGCGKTTTLRIIAGFETPTAGTVRLAGRDVTDVPPYERGIGVVFQDFALFPHLTVAENVGYGLTVGGDHSKDEVEDRVQEMLDLVELPDVGPRKPAELSGGQQQRVALARALAPEPAVLLLDEPLASLDKKLRENMQVELTRIQDKVGITTVFVTHNQEEALSMSDRIAVMNEGQFEQVGPPTDVYNDPRSTFVADFLGKSNLFEGTVTDVEGEFATVDCGEGLTIRTRTRNGISGGDDVTVAGRPEKFRLNPDGASENQTLVEGTVDVIRYQGDVLEYHVVTDSGREILVMEQGGGRELGRDDRVRVGMTPDDTLILEQ